MLRALGTAAPVCRGVRRFATTALRCDARAFGATSVCLATAGSPQADRRFKPFVPETPSIPKHNGFEGLPEGGEVRESWRQSVQARTVGNHALRRYIRGLSLGEYTNAVEAVAGARDAGMKLDSDTHEAFLHLLLRAGQLRLAMASYETMLEQRVCPHTKSFNHLMALCVDQKLPASARKLFDDMQKRGRKPDVESHELLLRALALEKPPQWEEAVRIFDKLQRTRATQVSSHTYNALMQVYLNMEPFEWRVVYNAYLEMRNHKPRIPFGWNTYELVDAAMVRGGAGRVRRFLTYLDAWIQITEFFTFQFWFGLAVALVVLFVLRVGLAETGRWLFKRNKPQCESMLDGELKN